MANLATTYMIILITSSAYFKRSCAWAPLQLQNTNWLKGFENCSNYLFLFQEVSLAFDSSFKHLHAESGLYLTLAIYDNADIVHQVKEDYRKFLNCQTISLAYANLDSDLKHLERTVELITINMMDMNPVSAKVPNGTIQVLPTTYFLIGPSHDSLSNDKFILSLFTLWSHPFKTKIFTIEVYTNEKSGLAIPNLHSISFVCHICNFWKNVNKSPPGPHYPKSIPGGPTTTSLSTSSPQHPKNNPTLKSPQRPKHTAPAFSPNYLRIAYRPNFVKIEVDVKSECPEVLVVGCRGRMDTIEQIVTQSGRNISYWIPSFIKFIPNIDRLYNMLKHRSTFYEAVKTKPHLDEVIMATLLESVGREKLSSSMDVLSPWIAPVKGTSAAFASVFTRAEGFKFLTCDGLHLQGISLSSYLLPFQGEVWLGVILSIVWSCGIVSILVNTLKTQCGWRNIVPENNSEFSFNSLFFTISALLLETDVVVGVITKSRRFRWFMFSWLFGSLILSTAYKGDNISTVIVPQISTRLFQSFNQLIGFTLYTNGWVFPKPPPTNGSSASPSQFNINKPDGNMQSSLSMQFGRYISWKYGRDKLDEVDSQDIPSLDFVSSEMDETLIKLYKSLRVTPIGAKGNASDDGIPTILNLLGSCHKTTLVADQDDIDLILEKLKTSKALSIRHKFYAGSDVLLPQPYTWSFSKNAGNYLPRRIQILFHSGIIDLWERLIVKNKLANLQLDDNRWSDQKPISLQSNIITIFVILMTFCGICVVVLLVEIVSSSRTVKKRKQAIRRLYTYNKLYWQLEYYKLMSK